MTMEPIELFVFSNGSEGDIKWHVQDNLPYFDGHFPDNPILPAIALVDASIEALRQHLALEQTPFIKQICTAKFKDIVAPGDVLTIKIEQETAARWNIIWTRTHVEVATLSLEI